ncbi:MAG TPA: HAMP domain-containing sensor histidine kinase [Lacibacter sp.]|nr:HAMP domain-containing sensor histidine kinase [Lacibacter sp.]HMO89104.1 HAMP domain-containing sensor histidine kinase [Lacibacter sp.]HMP85801.1 HAMP domain-containing sensor histidine kinase [Lacibacter sp.]
MVQAFLNWRTLLALVAILIVSGTVFYSDYLANKIAAEERQKVEQWVEAGKFLIQAPEDADTKLPSLIRNEQKSIPIIETDEKDSVISFINIDSALVRDRPGYLQERLQEFRRTNPPLVLELSSEPLLVNRYYYGHSDLLREVRYYPLIQLVIVALFIVITLLTLQLRNRSTQNQVWAGMAKETAHQLGTPVSSLQGWVEMLKESGTDARIVSEMEKDVNRLKLVSDRFGKIGSTPQLTPTNLIEQVAHMTDYMRRRAADKIRIEMHSHGLETLTVSISPQLFDWVVENLLKNALDAMEGTGRITIDIWDEPARAIVEVSDTGKGIPRSQWDRIFKPGFTTKKRGWGLGLSLSKRIMEQYHKGQLFVKHSEPGKGTTFRVEVPRGR